MKIINRIINLPLIKVSSITSISTFIKMLTAFITTKIAAVLIGPSGLALVGQLQNFSSIVMAIATGGINTGVTKYVAEYKNSKNKIRIFISTALKINLTLSTFVGIVLILLSSYFSEMIFHSKNYSSILIIFGITIILYSLNILFLAILNGLKEFKKYVFVNIISSITGLVFSISLIYFLGVYGALLSIVTYQSVVVIITSIMLFKSDWFNVKYFLFGFSKLALKKYLGYTLMVIVSAFSVPVASIVIRNYITINLSLNDAGIWEGLNQLTNVVLMFINSTIITYYIPRLSELKEKSSLQKEIFTTAKIILPIAFFSALIIYLLKDLIIPFLFSSKFFPMRELVLFQMIGLFFKISNIIVATQLHAKAMVKEFVILEILFNFTYVIFAIFFINHWGLYGISIAFALNYFLLFTTMLFVFRDTVFFKKN